MCGGGGNRDRMVSQDVRHRHHHHKGRNRYEFSPILAYYAPCVAMIGDPGRSRGPILEGTRAVLPGGLGPSRIAESEH